MANPQKENGYTALANELLEAILLHPFTGQELKTILFIARETYGWSRKKSQISYTEIARSTAISRRNVIKICQRLVSNGVLFYQGTGDRHARLFGIQKNYESWGGYASDAQDTRPSDAQDTRKRQSSDPQDTRSSDAQDTTLLKQENNIVKQAEKKGIRPVDNSEKNETKKREIARLIKGFESQITNGDPRELVNILLSATGFDPLRVWGSIVQARSKRNPAGYLVIALGDPLYAVADSAMDQARREMRKLNY